VIWLRNEGTVVKSRRRERGHELGFWYAAAERENVVFIMEDEV